MSDFSTGGSAVVFATSGTAVSFSLAPATDAFTVSPVTTPGAHASTHGAAGSDPITTLGTVAVTSLSGTASTVAFGSGSAGTPSVTFTGDSNTGVYSSAADTVAITTAGTARVTVGSTGQITTGLGLAAAPVLSFSGDTNTGIYSPGADQVGIATAGTARFIVDASGRLLAGNLISATGNAGIQIASDSTSAPNSNAVTSRYSTDTTPSIWSFRKGRGTLATPTVVSSGDGMGQVQFYGHDGTDFILGAQISAAIDGTPGTNDMPGRLQFYTTADGAATGTERMRIDNAGLITGTGTSLGAWTSYTPTLAGTGWAIGNGTVSGSYCQIGKIVHYRATITFGTTSTFGASAAPTVTLPVNAKSAGANIAGALIQATLWDSSASDQYSIFGYLTSATVLTLKTIGTNGLSALVTATVPFTFATSDAITISGTYEAA